MPARPTRPALLASAALWLACGAPAAAQQPAAQATGAGSTYAATVVRVVDGDTVLVNVPAWASTPFATIKVRVAGIDTPESRRPPAKCAAEVKLGLVAKDFAHALAAPGAAVTVTYRGLDKYARIDGGVTLPDGRDWAQTMLASGMAQPYGGATKPNWCRRVLTPPAAGR